MKYKIIYLHIILLSYIKINKIKIVNPIGSEKSEISKYYDFPSNTEISVSSLEKFYEDVEAQRIKPNYKS